MTVNNADSELTERTKALLEPGEIELYGLIVHTDITPEEEPALHQATLAVGDIIADVAGIPPADTYVYSGNDDERFGINQHQGRTLEDAFVWECQQLLRDGTYDIVFYYEADVDQSGIVERVTDQGFRTTSVTPE